jgi:hypothetical protein
MASSPSNPFAMLEFPGKPKPTLNMGGGETSNLMCRPVVGRGAMSNAKLVTLACGSGSTHPRKKQHTHAQNTVPVAAAQHSKGVPSQLQVTWRRGSGCVNSQLADLLAAVRECWVGRAVRCTITWPTSTDNQHERVSTELNAGSDTASTYMYCTPSTLIRNSGEQKLQLRPLNVPDSEQAEQHG